MRLIDADELLDLIDTENQRCIVSTGHELTVKIIRDFIKHQPTVYNVNSVVEEIKELSIREFGEIKTYDVIKIIQAGGINPTD